MTQTRPAPSTYAVAMTAFTDDGSLDVPRFRAHLGRIAAAGVGVYVGGGGSGEGYVLSTEETDQVLHAAAAELSGVVPVRAMGVEPRSAAEMIAYGERVSRAGLDAMQVYSLDVGHGRKPPAAEIERYLHDVLDAVTIPTILSTHQSVGYWYPVDLIADMVDRYPSVIGINVTSPDVTYLASVIDAVGDRVEVHVGGPMHALTALALGGHGFLSSEANLAPRLCRAVVDAWASGSLEDGARHYHRLIHLFGELSRLGSTAATKAALEIIGSPIGRPRLPRLPLTDAARESLGRYLTEIDLAASEGLAG